MPNSRAKAPTMYSRMTANCSVWTRLGLSHLRVCICSVWHGCGVKGSQPELTAGGVDGGPPVAADGGVHAQRIQPIAEQSDAGRGRAPGQESGRGVERDEVDVGPQGTSQAGQLGRVRRP